MVESTTTVQTQTTAGTIVPAKEFAPQYYIRIFPRIRPNNTARAVISPTNVFAISTSKNTTDACGQWSIDCDFRYTDAIDGTSKSYFRTYDGQLDRDSWFFDIEPMDYVEIYMRRQPPVLKNQSSSFTMNHPFGVYLPRGDSYSFTPFSGIVDINGRERPLSMIEKTNCPDLILCGFVDSVEFDFSISEQATSNKFRISGRDLGKFLLVHQIFPNLAKMNYFKTQMQFQMSIPFMPVSQAIIFAILEGCVGMFQAEGTLNEDTKNKNVQSSVSPSPSGQYTEEYTITELGGQFTVPLYSWTTYDPSDSVNQSQKKDNATPANSKDTVIPNQPPVIEINPMLFDIVSNKTIAGSLPSWAYLGFAIAQLTEEVTSPGNTYRVADAQLVASTGQFGLRGTYKQPWGRIEERDWTTTRSIMNFSAGPIWNIIGQVANTNMSELWVDEVGNIVFRLLDDAWNQLDLKNPPTSVRDTNQIFENQEWCFLSKKPIVIDGGEIHSWNLVKSDDAPFSTLVVDQPSASLMGSWSLIAGWIGQCPITQDDITFISSGLQQQIDDQLDTLPVGKLTDNQLDDMYTSQQQVDAIQGQLEKFLKMQGNRVWSYNLATKANIIEWWQRFGVRPVTVTDLWSNSVTDVYINANVMFNRFANMAFRGKITVRGDSRFRLGRAINIQNLGIVGYITGVSHNFVWGEGWTTTIDFIRGQIPGTLTGSQDVYVADIVTIQPDLSHAVSASKSGKPYDVTKAGVLNANQDVVTTNKSATTAQQDNINKAIRNMKST